MNNPSAFPINAHTSPNGDVMQWSEPGMTLRDYFAAKALEGWRANPNGKYTTYADAAEEAYEYADAMLKARAQKGESV